MRDIPVKDWQDFVEAADKLQHASLGSAADRAYVFRGVPEMSYGLKPSLLRLLEGGVPDPGVALAVEDQALREFVRQAHLFLPAGVLSFFARRLSNRDVLDWWIVMQHHNAPTRLLDWTRSAFVAAYFAVEKDFDRDGAIWVLDATGLRKRTMAAHGRAHGPRPSDDDYDFGRFFLDKMAVAAIWPIEWPRATDRIVAQQGVFTVAEQILTDHGGRFGQLAEDDPEMFFRLIIRHELKAAFLTRLRRMNITASALFPGIDGLGRSIAELIRANRERAV